MDNQATYLLTSPLSKVLLVMTSLYIFSQLIALVLLFVSRRRSVRRASDGSARASRLNSAARDSSTLSPVSASAGLAYPPVSIITSLKGPTPGAVESVRSLLLQDYPAPVEIIFATLDANEPLIRDVEAVVRETTSRHTVKFVNPVDTRGLNPRTAKIHQAYLASQHPWIFMVCVDTRFSAGYLRKAIDLTEGRIERYVTSFPVIDSPQTFSAKLEGVGLNVDVSQFFLLATLSKTAACAYGGAFMFSRELASRCGAFGPLVKLLTDDITLAKSLSRVGGECCLTDELAYVRQEKHSFRQFWMRQVRWRMIAKYFLKDLFWAAPLSWTQLFLLIGYFITRDLALLMGLAVLMISRVLIGVGVQVLLETPPRDRWHAWVLPIYDWIAIPAWITAVLSQSVSWGPTLMRLDAQGAVTESIVLEKDAET